MCVVSLSTPVSSTSYNWLVRQLSRNMLEKGTFFSQNFKCNGKLKRRKFLNANKNTQHKKCRKRRIRNCKIRKRNTGIRKRNTEDRIRINR